MSSALEQAPNPAAAVDRDGLARVAGAALVARQVGECRRPIRLAGSRLLVSEKTGAVVSRFDSADLPDGVLRVRCGTRRASLCTPCSTLYRFDAYNLVAAGLRGGKDTPASVGAHPRLFVTLTAPSFGPVHLGPDKHGALRPCHPRPVKGGLRCGRRHKSGDPLVGAPLDPDSYDYVGQVLFNAVAGMLWSRFTVEVRRALAGVGGVAQRRLGECASVVFAKVAEYQGRGVVHFHAVVRVDGPDGPSSAPPSWASTKALAEAVRQAATKASVTVPLPDGEERSFTFGEQLDIRPICPHETFDDQDQTDGEHRGGDAGSGAVAGMSDAAVARYVAKYATKSTECAGAELRPIWCRPCQGFGAVAIDGTDRIRLCSACHGTGRPEDAWEWLKSRRVSAHARRLVETCWQLGGKAALAFLRLRRWAHMLGFRGHFATKSRAYSTTFGALRAERAAWAATGTVPDGLVDDGDTVLVVNDWRYLGQADPTEALTRPGTADVTDHSGQARGDERRE